MRTDRNPWEMHRYALLLGMLLLSVLPQRLNGQPHEQADVLLRRWSASQRQAARAAGHIDVRETMRLRAEGPFGRRMTEVTAALTVEPGRGTVTRDVLSVREEGRDAHAGRRGPHPERGGQLPFVNEQPLLGLFLAPGRHLAGLRPTGRAVRDQVRGLNALRVDLAAGGSGPLEQVSVWLDPDGRRLLRMRAVLRGRDRSSPPIIVVGEYERVRDLDVLRRRTADGTLQTKRRMRTFTTLIELDADYDGYRFAGDD